VIRALLLASLAGGALASVARPQTVGQAAPAFELETLDGGRASLDELRGRPVLINFWASWCRPCSDEMPEIVRRYQELHSKGLEVLAINLTDDEKRKDVRRFAEEFQLPFPVLLDARGKVRRRYGLSGVPRTVFVDTAGVVAEVYKRPMTPDLLERGLKAILPLP
jgi:peroxiredoxin